MRIVFQEVTKTYASHPVLSDVNFIVENGEFVVLVGPSGVGKTTILKLILHQIRPNYGKIFIDDTNLSQAPSGFLDKFRRNIGVVFQDYQLIGTKTLSENIILALDINNISPDQYQSRLQAVLSRTGLLNKANNFPSQLSGGELQRASLARALAIGPKLLLADEPTGNLDPENAQNLVEILKEINQSGTTIIMTTHNMDIVSMLKTRVMVLQNGSLEDKTVPVNSSKKNSSKKK